MSVPHIPGFRILKPLAEGRRSLLFLAEQESLQRPVALKILTGEMAGDNDSRRRLIEQEKAAARLTHPNILAVFDIGEHNGSHYIATEYVTGGTLRDRLTRRAVSPEQALAVTRDLAQGLSFLHEQGFLHRDIKPSNILFREDGTAVLGDTGITRMEDAAHTEVSFGSPHYMSPEQAQSQACDGRSDLYSLGVVLFEMCSGRPPFDAEDPFEVAIKHISETPPNLPQALAKLQPLVSRLLAKQPGERFTSAAQLVQVLEQALSKLGTRPNTQQTPNPPAAVTQPMEPHGGGAATVVQSPLAASPRGMPDPGATVVNRPVAPAPAPDPGATVVNRPVQPDPSATVVNRPVAPVDAGATLVNRPVMPDPGATAIQPAVPDLPASNDAATMVQAAVRADPTTMRMASDLVEPVFPPTFPPSEPRKFEVPRYVEPRPKSFAWLWILLTVLLLGGGGAIWWFFLRDKQAPTITIPTADSGQLAGTAAAGGEDTATRVAELLAKAKRLSATPPLACAGDECAAGVIAQAVALAPNDANVILARQEIITLIAQSARQMAAEQPGNARGLLEAALESFPGNRELQSTLDQINGT